jgi:outer membrane protein assembly factor BamD
MFKNMKNLLFIGLIALFLGSCSEYQKALKTEDVKVKNEMAQKYYDEGDFKRANRLYEQIIPKFRGKPQAERLVFFLANSYYQTRDYINSGYQFEKFTKSYPKSEKVEEAAFLEAKSYYHLSPKFSIDQSETDKAIGKLQQFINLYPNSEKLLEANQLVRELRTKLEKKAFEIAKQYNTIRDYKSSITVFDNFLSDFPGTPFREEALFYKFDSSYERALNTYESLKLERLNEAKDAYASLKKYFNDTEYTRKADKMISDIDRELATYSN